LRNQRVSRINPWPDLLESRGQTEEGSIYGKNKIKRRIRNLINPQGGFAKQLTIGPAGKIIIFYN
jgi:hypothetical protein